MNFRTGEDEGAGSQESVEFSLNPQQVIFATLDPQLKGGDIRIDYGKY